MNSVLKKFNLDDKEVAMTEFEGWYCISTIDGNKSFFEKYSAYEDADYVFDDQVLMVKETLYV